MEGNTSKSTRAFQAHIAASARHRRSGYEPSDADTDWQDSPHRDQNNEISFIGPDQSPNMQLNVSRYPIALNVHRRRHSSKFDASPPKQNSLPTLPPRRHNSKSPYKPRREDGGAASPLPSRRNISPFQKSVGRHVSPYKAARDGHEMNDNNNDIVVSNRRKNQRTPNKDERVGDKFPNGRRSTTAPRQRTRGNDQENLTNHIHREQKDGRSPSPLSRNMPLKQRERQPSHVKTPSVTELNEMVANIKLSRGPALNAINFESTESISPGDIFFSRYTAAFANGNNLVSKPVRFPHVDSVILQHNKVNGGVDHDVQRLPSSTGSRPTMTRSSTAISAQSSKFSTESSKITDASGRTTASMKKFTANRRKSQAETWFSCMRRGTCKTSSKSPERQQLDEASFIERAFVVETLRQFWADKHQPRSLNEFVCHKQEAQLLRQLVSHDGIPHILLKGPYGAGKKALAMALLSEIFGDESRNISHELKYFEVQDQRMQVAVPVTSSVHHVELNVNLEPNAKHALMSLVKEISSNHNIIPEISTATFRPDYKVIVLYQVDKAAENIQHLIKWIMDCYTDACKLILCCEDDVDIIESVKSCCKIISLDVPVTHEIMEILIQIARKEDFDLSMKFAAKIAAKSKQNLRKAIMALEACKAHKYPFVEDQPVPIGWEDVLIELASEILADPSPKRLFFIRGKFQKLLVDFVHPKLILQKLVEQFLKGVETGLKRELYYWHAYYDKRLPTGTSALLKLEEFVAKFMSIYRRSGGVNHQVM